ncbi:glycosyltransferase [Terriglobus saanensis]|nr:glycosyltransferase [Terriglobus saanensis]
MMRILMAAHPSPAHVNALVRIAKYLRNQGHEVTFLTSSVFEDLLAGSGVRFLPLSGIANHDYRERTKLFPELAAEQSYPLSLNGYMKFVSSLMPEEYESLKQILQNDPMDLIFVDPIFFGALPLLLDSGSRRPSLISIGMVAPLLSLRESSPFTGYDASPDGLRRNETERRKFNDLTAPGRAHIDSALAALGLEVPGGFTLNLLYTLPDAFLQLGTAEFDFPSSDYPRNFRFIGPLPSEEGGTYTPPGWLSQLEGQKPVVFVSQGGIANLDPDQLIRPALEALQHEELDLVVTQGGRNGHSLPNGPNIHIERYLPYESILPKTDVFLTNGGFNGVQQALAFGVPVIVAGITEEKLIVGHRVAQSGAGLNLATSSPSKEQIHEAVFTVLKEKAFRQKARELQASFAHYDALRTIGEVAESLVANSKR